MAYAILRTKKLKSMGAVARSARHTFREQPTPNADPGATGRNRTVGAKGAAQVLAAFERDLPAKRRKDAVIAVEYLITASPEAFKRHGGALNDTGSGYFADALEWLRKRHGAANVISSTVHLDERTPHLVAYVLPKTKDGRLSARDFLGGPKVLREMQDSFHAACGEKRGLERGVKGSSAKHEDIKTFYADLADQGEAPKLSAKDYAAAAVGLKTKAWEQAEAATQKHAKQATRARRRRKHDNARGKALGKAEVALEGKTESIEARLAELENREQALAQREAKVSDLADRVQHAEAVADAYRGREAALEQRERELARKSKPERGSEVEFNR